MPSIDNPACPWCGAYIREHFTVPASVRVTIAEHLGDHGWQMTDSDDYETHDGSSDEHYGCANYDHTWPDLDAYAADLAIVQLARDALRMDPEDSDEELLTVEAVRALYHRTGLGIAGRIASETRAAIRAARWHERWNAKWHRERAEEARESFHVAGPTAEDIIGIGAPS